MMQMPSTIAPVSARRPSLFDDPDLLDWLRRASPADLDAAALGVIGMSHDGVVRLYNRWESERAGLHPSRVLGKHFFTEVATCCDNERVGQRLLSEEELDVTLEYTFAFRLRLVPVRLRLLRSARSELMYMLVEARKKR